MSKELDAFDAWNEVKKLKQDSRRPKYNEGEVWWCSLGANIGNEQDGKGKEFVRPVLVLRKFNSNVFWGVPFTTKVKHNNKFYHPVFFNNMEQCVILSQLKLLDARRFGIRMGTINDTEVQSVKKALMKLF